VGPRYGWANVRVADVAVDADATRDLIDTRSQVTVEIHEDNQLGQIGARYVQLLAQMV
jgi:hypothetical protein